jgi:hypothetical protein
MGKAMNNTGRHMHFNMCEWGKENPWEWGDDCAQVRLSARAFNSSRKCFKLTLDLVL